MLRITMENGEPKYWNDQKEIEEKEYFEELEKEERKKTEKPTTETERHFMVKLDGTILEVVE